MRLEPISQQEKTFRTRGSSAAGSSAVAADSAQCSRPSCSQFKLLAVFFFFQSVQMVSQCEQEPWLTRAATTVRLQRFQCIAPSEVVHGQTLAVKSSCLTYCCLSVKWSHAILSWPLGIHSHIQRGAAHWAVSHFGAIQDKILRWICHQAPKKCAFVVIQCDAL